MKTIDQLTREEIIVALNKDWMTHDGMWFFNSVMDLGIEKANQLNLAAIEGMTQVEIHPAPTAVLAREVVAVERVRSVRVGVVERRNVGAITRLERDVPVRQGPRFVT